MGETTRGRPKLNLDFAQILGAVHRHRQVVAAAQELGCSDAYLHGRFKQAGLSLKQVLQARHPDKVNGPNETRSLVLSRPGQGVSRGRPQANSHLTLARAQVSRHLSRRLPYYLTPEEAHLLIDSAENERDSEAVAIKLDQVGRDGIPVRGKGDVERVVFI